MTKKKVEDKLNGLGLAAAEKAKIVRHAHYKRVTDGWKAMCGSTADSDDSANSIIEELKGLEALSKVLSPSMWLQMPDPELLIDLYRVFSTTR